MSDDALAGVLPPSSYAFSFYAGDFYLYAAPGALGQATSKVIHYDPVTKTADQGYLPDAGITIVGAGVSTCAPVHK